MSNNRVMQSDLSKPQLRFHLVQVRTAAGDDDEGDDDDSKSGESTSDGESEHESEEESPGQNIHAERRKKYQEDYAKLVGSTIKVCEPLKHHFCV
jgi:cobalamin biosynthesis protein CobT